MANNGGMTRKVTQDNFVTEKIDVIKNNLLGSYDDEGNYFIAPQIIDELIKLEKVKKSSFANSVFCVGNLLGYGELVFELLFDSKTHNGKSASSTLYLLEDVDKINGYLQNTIKTKLEDFTDEVENFIQDTYAHFNIKTSTDDDDDDDAEVLERKLKDDLENEDSFIIAKKQFSLMLEKLLSERFLDAYGKYFTSRISVLTKLDNDFSKAVLDSFYRQYSMIQNVFLQEQNYMNLNELLDKCFEEISGTNEQFVLQEKEYQKEIQPSLDNFVDNVNKLNEKYEHKALNMLDKDDRKKVEEILDEHEHEEDHPERESKQSVERMVNDVQNNVYTIDDKKESEKSKNSEDSYEKKDNDLEKETHFIEEIKKNGRVKEEVEKEEQKSQQSQSFYSAFKEQHPIVNSATKTTKVVDTSITEHIESHNNLEQVSALGATKSDRLNKFKNTSITSGIGGSGVRAVGNTSIQANESSDTKVENIFEALTKVKASKHGQFDIMHEKNRRAIDNITPNYLDEINKDTGRDM